jgi:hypothetical protein
MTQGLLLIVMLIVLLAPSLVEELGDVRLAFHPRPC